MKNFFSEVAELKESTLSDAELDMIAGGKSRTLGVLQSAVVKSIACLLASVTESLNSDGICFA